MSGEADGLEDIARKYEEALKHISEIEERLTKVEKLARGMYVREGKRLRAEDKTDYAPY